MIKLTHTDVWPIILPWDEHSGLGEDRCDDKKEHNLLGDRRLGVEEETHCVRC